MQVNKIELINKTYIDYEIKNETLRYQGYWLSVNKYILHSFTSGTPCFSKDKRNFQSIQAKVIKVLENEIHIQNKRSKTIKKYSIYEFIQMNYTMDTLIRLEYKGKGLYSNWKQFWEELPEDQKQLFQNQFVRNKSDRGYKPRPEQSFRYQVNNDWKFAFNSYDQLFKWFHLDELIILMNNGVEIKYLQKLVDYCETIVSSEQVMYTNNPQANKYLRTHDL
jgi:hypothetical protein